MKIVIFKLLEFISSIFSKSHQLKDINIISLTKGFNLKINIFESISKNKSYQINYIGNLSFIRICLMKNKIPIGLGQIYILNQKQKQNIKIFPTNNNPNKKIINLVLICYNKKSFSEKYIESYRSPYKTTTYHSNFNNCNTNNTSSISISSLIISPNKNKTPIIKNKNQKKKGQRNKSQTNIKDSLSENRQLFINLSKNSLYSLNNNKNIKYKDLKKNISVYSNENSKRQLSGSISCYSNNFSEKREKHKKITSPIIYSFPYEKDNINEKINPKTSTNKRRNIKNKSMIDKLIIPNIDLEINNKLKMGSKFMTKINIDTINKQIEDYIIDKSFEDILQKDMPIISQEDKQFLYYDDLNMSKFDKLVEDILLLYKDKDNKIDDNDIKLEILFLIEKIYEIMDEYYKEYNNFNSQNKSLINIIKYYGYRYNNLLKMENKLKIKINKNKIKSDLNNNKNKCYISNINKINNELKLLNNINKSNCNNKINIKNNKNELKELLSHIIQKNKNKNKVNDEQKNKLKKIGININNDNKNSDKNKIHDLILSNSNKKMIYSNKNIKSNIYHKRKNSIETSTNKKVFYFNSNIKDKNKYRVFGNNILKIKVKTKINNKK